jgi:hypothetical protein
MSHGKGRGQHRARAVEVVLYHDDDGNYQDAKATLTAFLKSNDIPYRLMSDVAD